MIKVNKNIIGAAVCVAVIGCSDHSGVASPSSGETKDPVSPNTLLKGVVDSGIYKITNVCLDQNKNLSCEKNEKQVLTSSGNYQFTVNAVDATKYGVVAEVFKNTEKELAYVLTAPIGKHKFISPISNLAASMVDYEKVVPLKHVVNMISRNLGVAETNVLEDYLDTTKFGEQAEFMQFVANTIAQAYMDNLPKLQERLPNINANQMNNLLNSAVHEVLYAIESVTVSTINETTISEYDTEDMDWLKDAYAEKSVDELNNIVVKQSTDTSFLNKKQREELFKNSDLYEFSSWPDYITNLHFHENEEGGYKRGYLQENFTEDESGTNILPDLIPGDGWQTTYSSKTDLDVTYYLTDAGWRKQQEYVDHNHYSTDKGIETTNPTGSSDILNLVATSLAGESIADYYYREDEEGNEADILDKSILFTEGATLYKRYANYASTKGYHYVYPSNMNPTDATEACLGPEGFNCPPKYGTSSRHIKHTLNVGELKPVVLPEGETADPEALPKVDPQAISDLFLSELDINNPKAGLEQEYGLVYFDLLRLYPAKGELNGQAVFVIDGDKFESSWSMESYPGEIELLSVTLPAKARWGLTAPSPTKVIFTIIDKALVHGYFTEKGTYLISNDLVNDYVNEEAAKQLKAFITSEEAATSTIDDTGQNHNGSQVP